MNAMPDGTKTNAFKPKDIVIWLWYWLPPLAWMAMIFYFSHQPSLPRAPGYRLDAVLKKLTHVAEYVVLFLLLFRAWRRARSASQALNLSLLTAVTYAISDELHQAWVPGRNANGRDVLIDASGALLLWWLLRSRCGRGLFSSRDEYGAE